MRVAWCTDIHLDFLSESQVDRYLDSIVRESADAVIVAGDIATARSIEGYLSRMAGRLGVPVYFVLGNHDFYHGSIEAVRRAVGELAARTPPLCWLNAAGVVSLTRTTALVGHDGWGDARIGDWEKSPVELSDFFLIDDLASVGASGRAAVMQRLGDEAGAHLRRFLPEALASHRKVIVVTHVPPFREAAWYDGEPSNDDWAPYFTCRAAGDALLEAATSAEGCEITVLCGHTHGDGTARILPNLTVVTGGARYRRPVIQGVIEVE